MCGFFQGTVNCEVVSDTVLKQEPLETLLKLGTNVATDANSVSKQHSILWLLAVSP